MSSKQTSRRVFLRTSVAVLAAPYVVSSSIARGAPSKNDRLGVAAIGVGGQGTNIGVIAGGKGKIVEYQFNPRDQPHRRVQYVNPYGHVLACCDVDRERAEKFAAHFDQEIAIYGDYRKVLDRKDVDVVTVGTPDHWHAKIVIDAMQAGKDVYCEKPLSLTIEEGKLIAKVVRQTQRVLQVGTMQRSCGRFLTAVALARSGRLGTPVTATCTTPSGRNFFKDVGPFPNEDPPTGLDWDMWLGQAPLVPYCRKRCRGSFRYWLEYSGGLISDWGAHHVDIGQWGVAGEPRGVIEVEGTGVFPNVPPNFSPSDFFAGKTKLPNGYNTASDFDCAITFPSGNRLVVKIGPDDGVFFEGSLGRIFVNRRRVTGAPIEAITASDKHWLAGELRKLYKDKTCPSLANEFEAKDCNYAQLYCDHVANFFDCVRDRSLPVSDAFSQHRSISLIHMCNIAMLLKRKLRWDLEGEEFLGDAEANALLGRKQREPYTIRA